MYVIKKQISPDNILKHTEIFESQKISTGYLLIYKKYNKNHKKTCNCNLKFNNSINV